MKKYIRSSITDLELSYQEINSIESGLYSILKDYFYDGNHSHTSKVTVSEHNYNILRYTAKPYSGYSSTRAQPCMNKNSTKLNEFRSKVRKFLKSFGVTRVKFDISSSKVHYGYISGPDDFPVVYLNAIYFG